MKALRFFVLTALLLGFVNPLSAQDSSSHSKRSLWNNFGKKFFFTSLALSFVANAHPDWRPDPDRFTLNHPRTRQHHIIGFLIQGIVQTVSGKRGENEFLGVNSLSLLYETHDALRRPGNIPPRGGLGFGFADHLAYANGQALAWLILPGPDWIFNNLFDNKNKAVNLTGAPFRENDCNAEASPAPLNVLVADLQLRSAVFSKPEIITRSFECF